MGWVYNLNEKDPNSEIPKVIGICLAFSILSLFAVCLRFYVRISRNRSLWIDDYAALASSALTLGYAGIAVAQTRWGQGLTSAFFPEENVIPFSKIQYAGGPVYCLDLLGFKVALLASYLRIGGVVALYRKTVICTIAICVVNQLIFTFIMSMSCTPIAKQWDSSLEGHCIDTIPFYFCLAGISIGLDIVIIALPLPVLWRLQLRTKQKLLLICLFALGFFVTVIQVIRIFTIKALKTYTDSKSIVIWSCVEVSLGVVVSCIPTYGPLFKSRASTDKSYQTPNTGRSYPLGTLQNEATTGLATGSSRRRSDFEQLWESEGRQTTVVESCRDGIPDDADSQKHILPEAENLEVYVTSEFTIKTDAAI
ncbi:hypothetical protein N7490_009708 [Penicillium lividum]|nr:hypothetical protein N7490_009708 [Penicillium lividum]